MHQHRFRIFVGIDLGRWLHVAHALDADGEFLAERGFAHSGEGLSETVDWLLNLAEQDVERIAVAIEKPHGAVVETLLERGIAVFAINPKQVDRFRDRYALSGAKDDRRDAFVLADALREPTAIGFSDCTCRLPRSSLCANSCALEISSSSTTSLSALKSAICS